MKKILVNRAIELMHGDKQAAEDWLDTLFDIFDLDTPLEYASRDSGFKDVLDLIVRFEHGVLSRVLLVR